MRLSDILVVKRVEYRFAAAPIPARRETTGITSYSGGFAPTSLFVLRVGSFVLPPPASCCVYAFLGDRLVPRLNRGLGQPKDKSYVTRLPILSIVGFLLARSGVGHYLDLFGFVR